MLGRGGGPDHIIWILGGDVAQLLTDYQDMVEDGLLLDHAEPFYILLQRCQALALKENAAVAKAARRPALASKSACRRPLVG